MGEHRLRSEPAWTHPALQRDRAERSQGRERGHATIQTRSRVRAAGRGCVEERGITGSRRVVEVELCVADVAKPPFRDPSPGSVAGVDAPGGASPEAPASRLAFEDRGDVSVTVSPANALGRSASRRARSRTPRCRCACRRAYRAPARGSCRRPCRE